MIAFFYLLAKLFGYAKKVNVAGQVMKPKRTLKEEWLYGFHVMFHPFDGFWDIKHEKRASAKGATFILLITIVTYIYSLVGKAYLIDPHPEDMNVFLSFASILLPIILWVVANWCLTTLFDGEGSMKDIYIATCYSLFPLPAFLVLTTLLSNIVTLNEASVLSLAMNVAYFWVGFLLFFGTMVIHDYTLFKNVLTTLGDNCRYGVYHVYRSAVLQPRRKDRFFHRQHHYRTVVPSIAKGAKIMKAKNLLIYFLRLL